MISLVRRSGTSRIHRINFRLTCSAVKRLEQVGNYNALKHLSLL